MVNKMDKNKIFYHWRVDAERLECSVDDAVDGYLAECEENGTEPEKEIKIYAHTPMPYTFHPEDLLEHLIERADEDTNAEFATEPTEKMRAAAAACCEIMQTEYTPYMCVRWRDGDMIVDVKKNEMGNT